MKKNIKDYIGTKTAILIDAHTPEQENDIKDLLLADGRITRWYSGDALHEYKVFGNIEKPYCLDLSELSLTFISKSEAKSKGYQIIPASEFLQLDFEYLEEIEVSDFEGFEGSVIRKYIATLPNGKIFTLTENGESALPWKYARKINHERTEAITTIKELMQKLNISKDEL